MQEIKDGVTLRERKSEAGEEWEESWNLDSYCHAKGQEQQALAQMP